MTNTNIPHDKINLRLILPTFNEAGRGHDFIFSPHDSAGEIAQFVFDHWPQEWAGHTVEKADILRLIFQGRFLHENVTLGILHLPLGRTTVMHLVPRESLPRVNSQDLCNRSKDGTEPCCLCFGSCSII